MRRNRTMFIPVDRTSRGARAALLALGIVLASCADPSPPPIAAPPPDSAGDEPSRPPDPPSASATLRLRVERGERGPEVREITILGVGAPPPRVVRLPFPLRVDTERDAIDLDPREPRAEVPGLAIASNGRVVAFVGDAGALAIRLEDGAVRFASPTTADEPLGFDEAQGTVTQGDKRCPFADARRGRLALACGARLVLLRGGTTLDVLEESGLSVAGNVLVPTGRAIEPRVDARIESIRLEYRGRIFVR